MLGYIFPKVNARKVNICIFMNKFVYLRKDIFLNKIWVRGVVLGPLMEYSNTINPAHEGSFMPCSLYKECWYVLPWFSICCTWLSLVNEMKLFSYFWFLYNYNCFRGHLDHILVDAKKRSGVANSAAFPLLLLDLANFKVFFIVSIFLIRVLFHVSLHVDLFVYNLW